jgi:hypothetical protein
MYETLHPGTQFYRVTRVGTQWAEVLSGGGSFHNNGGRYNGPHQRTVYCSDDPLVAITECAFYQARSWQMRIGGGDGAPVPVNLPPVPPPVYPMVSEHVLWCFSLRNATQVVDLEHPQSLPVFGHFVQILSNPGQCYHNTQHLADAVRVHPVAGHANAEGIKCLSARTPAVPGYQPHQYVFFVYGQRIPGVYMRKWRLSLEFVDLAGNPVDMATRDIDWARPWFRLHHSRTRVPPFPLRPAGHAIIPTNWWYQLGVRFV